MPSKIPRKRLEITVFDAHGNDAKTTTIKKTKKPRPSGVTSKPKGVESESPKRLPFVQSDAWNQRYGLGPNATQDIYSDSNCCYCFRKTRPDAQRLAMILTHDGEWWLIAPTASVRSDEWDRFSLPVGPDCLRNHPEWRFALAVENPATGQPLPAERQIL